MCFGSWNKINPFITKYSQNQQFWNSLITVSEIPYPYYDLWNNQADIVILSFNNELVLLVHWWQRQATVQRPLRGDERAPDTPPANPCAQPSEAAGHFEVELRQHWSVREITKSSSTFSATIISSNMIWFFQLHDIIKMKSSHTRIIYDHNNITIRSHIMIYDGV